MYHLIDENNNNYTLCGKNMIYVMWDGEVAIDYIGYTKKLEAIKLCLSCENIHHKIIGEI